MSDLAAALPLIGLILFAILILLVATIALHDRRARLFAGGMLSALATIVIATGAGLAFAGVVILIGVLLGIPSSLLHIRLALP